MTLLAVFALLLYDFSGEDDLLIGTPAANRNQVDLEDLIGFFSNTIVMRTTLRGNPTFREVLRRVRETAVGAYAHSELPFEKLVESLGVTRNPAYNPIFQVNFRAGTGARDVLTLPGLEITALNVDIGFSRFDLALELQLADQGIEGYFEYNEDLFYASTIESLAANLESLLEAVAADPDRPILHLAGSARRLRSSRAIPVPRREVRGDRAPAGPARRMP
jgi:non-ribosomal peptide synthetase component F